MGRFQRVRTASVLFVFAGVACICLGVGATADVVYLANGERIEGRVVKETEKEITLDFGYGQTVLERSKITKIEKASFTEKKAEGGAATDAQKPAEPKPEILPPVPPVPKSQPKKPVPPNPIPPKEVKDGKKLPGEGAAASGAPGENPPAGEGKAARKEK